MESHKSNFLLPMRF